MSPTPFAAVLAAIGALSALVVPLWISLFGLALLAVSIAVDAVFCRRAPVVTRTLPPLVARGLAGELTVRTENRGRRVEVRQPRTADLVVEPRVGSAGSLDAELTALRRGRHLLPPVATRTTGPLGLARWVHRHGADLALDVQPDLPGAWRIARSVGAGTFADEGRVRGPLGLGTEFEYVRDYSPDDDVRQVNWAATVRTERPMSNQYRIDRDREVLCAIDAGRLMAGPVGTDRTRLDAALDALVAVGAVTDTVGDRFGALAFDDTVRTHLPPRRLGGAAVAAALHELEPSGRDSDYLLAMRTVGASKRALVLVLTDLGDEAAARTLVSGIDVLCATHAVVVASPLDPAELRLLGTEPESVVETYRNSLLAADAEARAGLAARLRGAGAIVVVAPPDRLPSACVAAYLRLKARARL